MTTPASAAGDAAALLERLIELTERESALIAATDAEAIEQVCDEREALLATLARAVLPPSLGPALARFATVRDHNLRAATAQRDDLRRRLGELGTGRSALTAYLPGGSGAPTGLERAG